MRYPPTAKPTKKNMFHKSSKIKRQVASYYAVTDQAEFKLSSSQNVASVAII